MTAHDNRQGVAGLRKAHAATLGGYAVFCGLGLVSRIVPAVFVLFVAYGIAFPLVWARFTHSWDALGFSRRNLASALIWGLLAGVTWGVYTYVFFRRDSPMPPLWGVQVAIAFPVWLLVMSPFQEFFFRGWLQPRIQSMVGRWGGLALTAAFFTLWHFCPQLEGTATATLPLGSSLGLISIFVAGLLFGYIHQRTGNILAPWLAHGVGGIALVLIGEMTFIQYNP
ncbi:MAG: CPBP family intramembrane metalloprotease [Anaerolineae bacterium]|nr:CPBP family intramembrane metalloprotease [Anaerolineae bacterium]